MEDLSKQQVILLAILVSIVTSIATGITTVSLVAQSPTQTVTQTINRVVEKTVERVVEGGGDSEVIVIPPEKEVVTIFVNEEEQRLEAITQNTRNLVRIYDERRSSDFITLGFFLRDDGMVYMPAEKYVSRYSYVAKYSGGNISLEEVYVDPQGKYVILAPRQLSGETFESVRVGNSNTLRIGQSVVALSGVNNTIATKGIVSSLNTQAGIVNSATEGEITEPVVTIINTSIDADQIIPGTFIISLEGNLIGVHSGREGGNSSFTPTSIILDALQKLPPKESVLEVNAEIEKGSLDA